MKVLFIHNNFPGQFRSVSEKLVEDPANEVVAIGTTTARDIPGVSLHRYTAPAFVSRETHSFARRFDQESRRFEQVLYILSKLRASGFEPEVIVAHCGWGESLSLRPIYPYARIITYCEFYYRSEGLDVNFDEEFPAMGLDGLVGLHARNASTLLALAESDAGVSPTKWQKSTYPKEFASKIKVLHEGVDTGLLRPRPDVTLTLPNGARFTKADEIITFVARNLEPLRGYHTFIRALPKVLKERPDAQILVIGDDGVSYGAHPPAGQTWREIFFAEIAGSVGIERVHFLGPLARGEFIKALQLSSVHVYYTYPFVLSWSLLEAMSCECLILASDTPPVREVISGDNGRLLPFFDSAALSAALVEALERGDQYKEMRRTARWTVLSRYDKSRICVPRMIKFLAG